MNIKLSETTLEDLLVAISNATDDRGLRIQLEPHQIFAADVLALLNEHNAMFAPPTAGQLLKQSLTHAALTAAGDVLSNDPPD